MRRKDLSLLFWFIAVLFSAGILINCQAPKQREKQLSAADYAEYKSKKQQISEGEKEALEYFDYLIKEADRALSSGPFSVVNKTGLPPSGDKHDYMSLAPYWWPNPERADGLPYIRKDGEVNPEARNSFSDFTEKAQFFDAVDALGKAYYYSGDEKYAAKVIELLRTWFIDTATVMNPHLDFGQGIRGINDGRCFGVIEFGSLSHVITTLELLDMGGALDSYTEQGVKTWLKSYSHWLQTSELGSMEGTRSNNHGTTYDVQLCSILLYLGEKEQVKARLGTITRRRIKGQIEPDGRQLHELARTKAFSYSTMNLSAFTKLAWYGKRLGIDLWNYESADGRSIRKAYDFLIPYVVTDKEWGYKQITQMESSRDKFANLLIYAGNEFNEPSYSQIGEAYFESKNRTNVRSLD